EREAEIRMEQPVEADAHRAAQHAAEDAVAEVAADQAVAMVEPQPTPLRDDRQPAVVHGHADVLGEEGPEPEIVVAVEIGDREAGLAQPLEHHQRREVPARDRAAVLEPEIEQIADDVEVGGASGQSVQEFVKPRLARRLLVPAAGSEMGVAHEEQWPIAHDRSLTTSSHMDDRRTRAPRPERWTPRSAPACDARGTW